MSDARSEVLGRVRDAIADAEAPAVPYDYRRAGSLDREACVELFCSRVDDYRAEVIRVEAAQIEATITAECAAHSVESMAIPPGSPWRPEGVALVEDHGLGAYELDRIDGALTGCTVAIAETGTIVLTGGPSEGRRALSLVPDLHVCVVLESQIYELVPEAFARLDARRPTTFVSGPSATSDIELSRVEGVHGPRTLIVLVAREEQ